MKIISLVSLIVTGSLMASSVAFHEPVTVQSLAQTVNEMPVVGPHGPGVYTTLVVQVLSGGCTKASDFTVQVDHVRPPYPFQSIRIARVQPDPCDMTPHPVIVELRTDTLKDARRFPVKIENALLSTVEVVY